MQRPRNAARLWRTAFLRRPGVAFQENVLGRDGAFQAFLRLRRAQSEAATRTLEGAPLLVLCPCLARKGRLYAKSIGTIRDDRRNEADGTA
jgi:hypothetical protein